MEAVGHLPADRRNGVKTIQTRALLPAHLNEVGQLTSQTPVGSEVNRPHQIVEESPPKSRNRANCSSGLKFARRIGVKTLHATLILMVACGNGSAPKSQEPQPGSEPGTPPSSMPPGSSVPPPVVQPGFTVNAGDVKMLPFGVLMGKLARAAGVEKTSPLLTEFVANRFEFGESDFANGVQPNTAWTTAKATLWVRSLRPLCASKEFTQRVKLPQNLETFGIETYGRKVTADEKSDFDALASSAGADGAYLSCLVLLSSAEFVTR